MRTPAARARARTLRSVRLSERCPLPMGVAKGPLRPTLLRITLSSASWLMRSPEAVTACVEMVCCSHWMGTLAACARVTDAASRR